jgi:hypothetical protein
MRDMKLPHAPNPRTSGDAVFLVCCSRIAPRHLERDVGDCRCEQDVGDRQESHKDVNL